MESDTSELFNTDLALSFDSTLDSLMDVDYIPDEKALPFSPPSFNASSEVPMSSQNSLREDLGHTDGDGIETCDNGVVLEEVSVKEVVKTNEPKSCDVEEIKECTSSKRNFDADLNGKTTDAKELLQENNETIQINIEIKERVVKESNSTEPSLNIDQIKAKRKKNLEKKTPKISSIENPPRKEADAIKASLVSKCPFKNSESNNDREEIVKEPPHKKMRISSKDSETLGTVQIDSCINTYDEDGKVILKAGKKDNSVKETAQVGEVMNEVSISEKETVKLSSDVMVSNIASEVDRKVETINKADKKVDIDKRKETSSLETTSKEMDNVESGQKEIDNIESGQKEMGNLEIGQKEIDNIESGHVPNCGIEKLDEQIEDDQIINEIKEEEESGDKTMEDESVKDESTESENEIEDLYNEAFALNYEEECKETDGDDEDNNDNDNGDDPGEGGKAEDVGDDVYDDFEDEEEDDVDDDEIHNWLEEGLTKEEIKEKKKADLKDGEFIANEKYILEEKGVNPFEVLPAGWIVISHNCGMPVYLHKDTRVCTFARPYNIGSGSSRAHEIPLSSIPCLQYRRHLAKEKLQENETAEKMTNGVDKPENKSEEISEKEAMPKPVIKSADDTDKIITLVPKELNEYCHGLFNFRIVTVKKFKTWREKRAHLVEERKKKVANMPTLAPETKLITCPIPPEFLSKKSRKKEFVLNPEGKTAVSILHEYTQNVLRVQPTYEFKEMSNADLPFKAIVCLNGMQYGSGVATGKRQAKNEGAKATLEILVPELAELWNEKNPGGKQKSELGSDLKFFESVAIEDPRVPELCVKSSLPQPYQVLHTCLQRNYGLGDTTFKVEKKMITNQKTEFTLSVGKRTCTVVCKNKREAKHKAAQTMLQQLHPLLKNWASILRLYSKNTEIGFEEQKDEFPEQVIQQEKKKNKEILGQLKNAMRKIREQRKNFIDGSQATSSGQTPATLDL